MKRASSIGDDDYRALADFRYGMRKFLRFSKETLAQHGPLTPEQYETMLALRGFAPPGGLTIGQLSERLQVKHHTAVTLIAKLVAGGVLQRDAGTEDRRQVFVRLTRKGLELLSEVAALHRAEMRERSPQLIEALRRLQS